MKLLRKTCVALACVAAVGCGSAGDQAESVDVNISAAAIAPAKRVASLIKSKVEVRSVDEMKALMKRQYVKTHLMNRNGEWQLEALNPISEKLLPSDLSMPAILDFIDRVAAHVEDNPYAVAFLEKASQEEFGTLIQKLETEGDTVIPQVVAWALAMENITKAEIDDPTLIELLSDFWIKEREKEGINLRSTGLFGIVKLMSVEAPIRKIIEFHKTKKLDPKFLRGMLPLNIFEAITADKVMGNPDNAAAGWPLYKNAPAEPENPSLGTGPATFSDDGMKIEVRMALPKQWADLYQVWNMAFLTQIDNYPFWMVKLLIPQVSDYNDYPEEYIYRRALALYTAEHYIFLGGKEDARDGIPTINWPDKTLTAFWGKMNKSAADDYSRQVRDNK